MTSLAIILLTQIVTRRGGGVGYIYIYIYIYISTNFELKIREDLAHYVSEEFESFYIEIVKPRTSNNIVIGVVYRPPGRDADLFNNLFELT